MMFGFLYRYPTKVITEGSCPYLLSFGVKCLPDTMLGYTKEFSM